MNRLFGTIFLLGFALAGDLRAQSHWEVKPSNTTSSLNAVAFGNGLFVAVGDNGAIVTSPDGERIDCLPSLLEKAGSLRRVLTPMLRG